MLVSKFVGENYFFLLQIRIKSNFSIKKLLFIKIRKKIRYRVKNICKI